MLARTKIWILCLLVFSLGMYFLAFQKIHISHILNKGYLNIVNHARADDSSNIVNIYFNYNDAQKGTIKMTGVSVDGSITAVFNKIDAVDNIIEDGVKKNSYGGLYKSSLTYGGGNQSYIIQIDANDNVSGIYGPAQYGIEQNDLMYGAINLKGLYLGVNCSSCQNSWLLINNFKYNIKYPSDAFNHTATEYFYNDQKQGNALQASLIAIINKNVSSSTYTGSVLPYGDQTAILESKSITELQTIIGSKTCLVTSGMAALQKDVDNKYWNSTNHSTLEVIFKAMDEGTIDATFFNLTAAGAQKLDEINNTFSELKQTIAVLKGKITPAQANNLSITWCKFAGDGNQTSKITKIGAEDGSEANTLNWLLKKLNAVNISLNNRSSSTVDLSSACGCDSLSNNPFERGTCNALCWISQATAKAIAWCIGLLIKAAGIQ